MDAVSHLIRLARVDASLDKHCMLSVSTTMDVSYETERTAPFHVLLEGYCQLQVGRHLLDLKPGDVVLIPRGESHRIITHGAGRIRGIVETAGDAFTTTLTDGGGEPVIDLYCGHYTFGPGAGSILFKSLPEPVHISFGETPETDAALRMLSTLMRDEAGREGEGTAAILSSLCSVLLTMILRTSRGATTDAALWTASTNTSITKVVERVLADPGGDWSIEPSAPDGRGGPAADERAQRRGRGGRGRLQVGVGVRTGVPAGGRVDAGAVSARGGGCALTTRVALSSA
jgi:AraC family transcriptional activator of mtrCDE